MPSGGSRTHAGRPKGSVKEGTVTFRCQVTARFTEDEYKELVKRASDMHMTIAAYIRYKLFA